MIADVEEGPWPCTMAYRPASCPRPTSGGSCCTCTRPGTETFLHGSHDALDAHSWRTAELEAEYLRRFPEREVDPERLRAGARQR